MLSVKGFLPALALVACAPHGTAGVAEGPLGELVGHWSSLPRSTQFEDWEGSGTQHPMRVTVEQEYEPSEEEFNRQVKTASETGQCSSEATATKTTTIKKSSTGGPPYYAESTYLLRACAASVRLTN